MQIPIIIGVTGHRNLRKEDLETLRNSVRSELRQFQNNYPNSKIAMLNSLAVGADQLCAEIAIELSIPIVVPLPMHLDAYREDFMGKDLETFDQLLKHSEDVFIAPCVESSDGKTRDHFYRQAGLYILRNCHVLMALWDGLTENASGCGTAAFVELKLNSSYFGRDSLLKPICSGAVLQIVTPRENQPLPEGCFSVKILENPKETLNEVLFKTEEYNADIVSNPVRVSLKWVENSMLDNFSIKSRRIYGLHEASDTLSIYFRDMYLKSLKSVSYLAVALVVSFLLYDELESDLFLVLYGMLMIRLLIVYLASKRKRYHVKYLDYRTLAETARVRFFLMLMNLGENLSGGFSCTPGTMWIQQAVSALGIGVETDMHFDVFEIKSIWIDDQLNYYQKAILRTRKKESINTKITHVMIFSSVVLFLVVFILEFGFKRIVQISIPMDPIRTYLLVHEGQVLIVRGLLKIFLGLVSATTVFLSNYYGKLSLRSKLSEYEKMVTIYKEAKTRFEDPFIPKEKLFLELAKEEMVENENWLNYCISNEVEIKI